MTPADHANTVREALRVLGHWTARIDYRVEQENFTACFSAQTPEEQA